MIVKGIIKTIDFKGNTCTVRIPVLENSANGAEVVIPAVFSMIPGLYNGYKVDDVVFVAFENDQLNSPVVISKLYLGADTESKNPRGAINADSFKATNPITIPVSTKLTLDNDPNKLNTAKVKNGLADFKSISDIIKGLQVQTEQIGSLDVQLVDTGKELGAKVNKTQDARTTGLGWNLTNDAWTIQAYDSQYDFKYVDLFKVTKDGVEISGDLKIKGLPRYTRTTYAITDEKTAQGKCPIIQMPWYYIDADHKHDNQEDPPLEPWSLIEPEQTLGKYLWVATTVWTYTYDEDSHELLKSVDTSIQEGLLLKYTYYYKQVNTGDPAPAMPANNTVPDPASGWATEIPTHASGKVIYRCTQVIDDDDPEGIRHITYKDLTPFGDGTLVVQQGKAANYYSDRDPYELGYNVKYGDCWFDTSITYSRVDQALPKILTANIVAIPATAGRTTDTEVDPDKTYYTRSASTIGTPGYLVDAEGHTYTPVISPTGDPQALDYYEIINTGCNVGTFKNRDQYNNFYYYHIFLDKYILIRDHSDYYPDNPDKEPTDVDPIKVGSTTAFVENQNVLRQCSGFDNDRPIWEDISGELITNKVTANYINALEILARKITVKDGNDTVFNADVDHPDETQIGGFNVSKTEIKNGVWNTDNSLLLASEGHHDTLAVDDLEHDWLIVAGRNFGVTDKGSIYAYDATFREAIDFQPLPITGAPWQNKLNLTTVYQNFGDLSIRGFMTYSVTRYSTVNDIGAETLNPVNPGYYDITDPGWGGGPGGGQGGSSSGGGSGDIHIEPWNPGGAHSGGGGVITH